MNISAISFGKKIPVSKCQVLDRTQNKPIEATLYEYDCKDLFDVYDVGDLDDTWSFRDMIASNMHSHFLKSRVNKESKDLKFYCMKNNEGETLGICQTSENDNDIDVKIINTSKNGKYKYVGQIMLAQLAQKVIDNGGQTLKIKGALPGTRDYYEKTCGFKCYDDISSIAGCVYKLENEELKNYTQRTQDKLKIYA